LGSSRRVVITDTAKAAWQRQRVTTASAAFFMELPGGEI
jgi:hypothetical protein